MPTSSWTSKNLKACLFDFGGTLDAEGVTWQDNFFGLYRKNGVSPDRELFRQAFYRADDSLTETGALEGKGFQETVEIQAAMVWEGLHPEASESTLQAIVADFVQGTQENIRRNRAILETLGMSYKLGIVSNFYGNLNEVCEDLGIHGLFHCLIDSNRVGTEKPDPKIFQAALDQVGVLPDEAVFVGDNVYRDMEGARNVGMRHILLAGPNRLHVESCCPGDPVIGTLQDLRPLLLNGGREPSTSRSS